MSSTSDLLALIRADGRRLALWLLGGWTIFALVLLLAMVDLGCRGCPDFTVSRFTGLKVLLFCSVYAMAPWVYSVHDLRHGTGLLRHLPLSHRDINRFILLRGLVIGIACLPIWGLVAWVLPRFGFTIHPWLMVTAGLTLVVYQLIGMISGRLLTFALAAVFPLVIFPPHTHRLLNGPLELAATPWAALLLAVLIAAMLPLALAHPLPRIERSGR